jgi:hypothetical protein
MISYDLHQDPVADLLFIDTRHTAAVVVAVRREPSGDDTRFS